MSLLPSIEAIAASNRAPQPLLERRVLVTGGAQGIGRGIAQAVLAAGGRVAVLDRDADAGRAALREWDLGARALFVRTDVAREGEVARALGRVLATFGGLDGVVNNAGIADPSTGPLDRLAAREWHRRIDASLGGAFLCSKHALPALRASARTRGRASAIVNIASTRATQSEPHSEAYAAAKGGLLAFTHALAISEGPAVRVNAISPGWIATDAWRAPHARRAPKLSRADHAQHPAGRVGTPPDIGALAVFLLSDASAFITGQEIVADGGMVRKMQYV